MGIWIFSNVSLIKDFKALHWTFKKIIKLYMNTQGDVKMLWNYSTKMKYKTGNKAGTTNFLKLKIFFSHTMYPTYSFPSFYCSQSLPPSPPTSRSALFYLSLEKNRISRLIVQLTVSWTDWVLTNIENCELIYVNKLLILAHCHLVYDFTVSAAWAKTDHQFDQLFSFEFNRLY